MQPRSRMQSCRWPSCGRGGPGLRQRCRTSLVRFNPQTQSSPPSTAMSSRLSRRRSLRAERPRQRLLVAVMAVQLPPPPTLQLRRQQSWMDLWTPCFTIHCGVAQVPLPSQTCARLAAPLKKLLQPKRRLMHPSRRWKSLLTSETFSGRWRVLRSSLLQSQFQLHRQLGRCGKASEITQRLSHTPLLHQLPSLHPSPSEDASQLCPRRQSMTAAPGGCILNIICTILPSTSVARGPRSNLGGARTGLALLCACT